METTFLGNLRQIMRFYSSYAAVFGAALAWAWNAPELAEWKLMLPDGSGAVVAVVMFVLYIVARCIPQKKVV